MAPFDSISHQDYIRNIMVKYDVWEHFPPQLHISWKKKVIPTCLASLVPPTLGITIAFQQTYLIPSSKDDFRQNINRKLTAAYKSELEIFLQK